MNTGLLNSALILMVTRNSSSVLAMVYLLLSVPTKNLLVNVSLRCDYAHKDFSLALGFSLANI